MKQLLYNARLVNEGKIIYGAVIIEHDRIVQVFHEPHPSCPVIHKTDFEGDWLLPGVIDDQVHFREPGLTHKGDIATESAAAVAGGITTYLEMPNTKPQTTTAASIVEKHQCAFGRSAANYSFYLGATNENIAEIKQVDTKLVCGIKVFMGSSTGNMLVNQPEALEQIFSQSPLLIATHCEDESTVLRNGAQIREQYGAGASVKYHPLVRDAEACYLSSSLAVSLAKKHHARLHVLHLSTAQEMDLFSTAPLLEKKITAEVCVHHLWFSDEDYEAYGTKIKWNPSIKSRADRDALRQALIDGRIDVVATDHAPHLLKEKEGGCFDAASGGPLVQHALVAMLEMYHQGIYDLELIVQKMCHNPALLYQIKDRGFIREGYFADLVRVRPQASWEVSPSNIRYKCKWSPFEGQRFQSKIMQTYVNGHLVYDQDEVVLSNKGIAITFNR